MEGPYQETMDEVSTVHGLNWSDASKMLLFDRFLQEEAKVSPGLYERFETFLEREADEELLQAVGSIDPDDPLTEIVGGEGG